MTCSSAQVMEIDSKVVQSVIFRLTVVGFFRLPGHHGCPAMGVPMHLQGVSFKFIARVCMILPQVLCLQVSIPDAQ